MKVYVAIWTYGEMTSEVLGVFSTKEEAQRRVLTEEKIRTSQSEYGSVEEHNLDIKSEDVRKQENLFRQVDNLKIIIFQALRQLRHNLFLDRDARVNDLVQHRLLNKLA